MSGPRIPNLFPGNRWEELTRAALGRPCHVCGAKPGELCTRFQRADDGTIKPTGPTRTEPHRHRML